MCAYVLSRTAGERPSQTARLLPIVALQQTADYDAWANRWFLRWLSETERPSIDQAAELAGTLADLPSEPSAMEGLQGLQGLL
jgi:hypothetical protein